MASHSEINHSRTSSNEVLTSSISSCTRSGMSPANSKLRATWSRTLGSSSCRCHRKETISRREDGQRKQELRVVSEKDCSGEAEQALQRTRAQNVDVHRHHITLKKVYWDMRESYSSKDVRLYKDKVFQQEMEMSNSHRSEFQQLKD